MKNLGCPVGVFQNSLFRLARPSVALRCTVALVALAFCAVCTAVKIYERIYTVTDYLRQLAVPVVYLHIINVVGACFKLFLYSLDSVSLCVRFELCAVSLCLCGDNDLLCFFLFSFVLFSILRASCAAITLACMDVSNASSNARFSIANETTIIPLGASVFVSSCCIVC